MRHDFFKLARGIKIPYLLKGTSLCPPVRSLSLKNARGSKSKFYKKEPLYAFVSKKRGK
jgi:hypothetical protein